MKKIYSLENIETPRLIIRPVQLGDEIELNKALNNSLKLLQQWQPWANDPSIDATRKFIQQGVFAWESNTVTDFPMVVIHKGDQKIIGASGYNDRCDLELGLYEIGYWIDVEYQGQGLVTEYVNALTRFALDECKGQKAIIRMLAENLKSIAVAKRLNFFCEEGIEHDLIELVTGQENKSHLYTRTNLDSLPTLDVAFTFNKENHHDADMIAWARVTLDINDDKIFNQSKAIIKTPWSNVLEINTNHQVVYLKQTPPTLYLEAAIIKLLRDKCHVTAIPKIIAENKEFDCFLMEKCGDISLRYYFDGKLQLDLLKQGVTEYKELQKSTEAHIDEFINLGVPDWRLDKFPALYHELILDHKFLTENGLSSQQQAKLHQYEPFVMMLCEKLACYNLPECLNHSDFHDNNILYDKETQMTAIIDLGETAINHPFFSLAAILNATKIRYALDDMSAEYRELQTVCYSGWLDSYGETQTVIKVIQDLLPIYFLFSHQRFINAACPIKLKKSSRKYNRVYEAFTWFIDNIEAYKHTS